MATKRTKKPAQRRKAAATADVVASGLSENNVPPKWKKYYARLIRVRDFLHDRQGELARDAAEEQTAFSLHMADAGTDSFDRDLALSQLSSEQDVVYEIEEAINRIRSGTYGVCELTGKRIESARLDAIPWTRFSVEASRMLEKEGAVRKARLAPRAAVAHVTADESDSGMGGGESEPD
jgi:RNA polymerase-binding transcription factor DksA